MSENKITALFEFDNKGNIQAIFLNAGNEKDQATLEKALNRLLDPGHFGWIKKLFGRG